MFIDRLRQQSQPTFFPQSSDWGLFLQKELPHKKLEDWKYTDLTFLNKENFVTNLSLQYTNISLLPDKELSLSINCSSQQQERPRLKGLTICSASELATHLRSLAIDGINSTWEHSNYFSDLQELTDTSNVYFVFDQSWKSQDVLSLEFAAIMSSLALTNLGIKIVVLPGVEVQLCERFNAIKDTFLNVNVCYYLFENSFLNLLKIDKIDQGRVHTMFRARLQKNSRLHSVHFTGNTQWARHNVYVELEGDSAHADLSASYLAGQGEFIDHHTFIVHKVANTTSCQEYSGVLADKSVGVFNGKVWIQRDAQKSNAEQLSRNLLLSKNAEANTKPELLIDADDVKAKHGATIGQMDQEELFYMQSRGLTPTQSREMVLKSFVFSTADKLSQPLKEFFIENVESEVKRFILDHGHV